MYRHTGIAIAIVVCCTLMADLGIADPTESANPLPPTAAGFTGPTFDALNVTVIGQVPLDQFPTLPTGGADIWGYVSPTGREYAIMGHRNGTAFIEVTDPANPVVIGDIPTAGNPGTTRDMKTFLNYAYSIGDGAAGLEVIDLAQIDAGIVTLANVSNDGGIFGAHNLALNTDSGFAYPVSSSVTSGLAAYDLTDPVNPTLAGTWTDSFLHDVLVVSYTEGPFAGREIAFGFGGPNGLIIIDVTDKTNMFTIASRTYPNLSYCHQGWLSEDRRYLFIADELDEVNGLVTTTTMDIFDVGDIENPQFVGIFSNGEGATDHNLIVAGRFIFSANYASGLRVYDYSLISNIRETGYFDTRPESSGPGFPGAWGAYPLLPSGVVIVSDRQRGLFVFDTSAATAGPPAVPTVSQWGMIIMACSLTALGTVLFKTSARRGGRAVR